MTRTTLPFLVVLAAGLAAACGDADGKRGISPTGSTEAGGIVVERTTLRSKTHCEDFYCWETCEIEGTVRNDTTTDRNVTITFQAFDGQGQAICWVILCTTSVKLVVPAGRRADFGEMFTSVGPHGCDRVARVEITELESEPLA